MQVRVKQNNIKKSRPFDVREHKIHHRRKFVAKLAISDAIEMSALGTIMKREIDR